MQLYKLQPLLTRRSRSIFREPGKIFVTGEKINPFQVIENNSKLLFNRVLRKLVNPPGILLPLRFPKNRNKKKNLRWVPPTKEVIQ
jgi:hypothetical protein